VTGRPHRRLAEALADRSTRIRARDVPDFSEPWGGPARSMKGTP